jgi:hypothetical protein
MHTLSRIAQLVGARAKKCCGYEARREICKLEQGCEWWLFLSLLWLVVRDDGHYRRCRQRTHSVLGTEQVRAVQSVIAGRGRREAG